MPFHPRKSGFPCCSAPIIRVWPCAACFPYRVWFPLGPVGPLGINPTRRMAPAAGAGVNPAGPSGPRILLRRLREVMAGSGAAQERMDQLVTAIAANMVGCFGGNIQ